MNKKALLILFCYGAAVLAQRGPGGPGGPPGNLPSLKSVRAPQPTGLETYVKDSTALVALGKAFFWDMQAGSDGKTACATCHFHAGADHRIQNQLSGAAAVANSRLTPQDFPFHKLTDVNNNRSAVVSDKRQVAGSAGVLERAFVGLRVGFAQEDAGVKASLAAFQVGGIQVRQVTARNSPSVINAVFNFRNFWDGRARNIFTGATPFGESDPGLNAWVYRDGQLSQEAVRMENASLASQAVGPALNDTEMSWAGRNWPQLGQKLMRLRPLARQKVASDDSVLGAMANPQGNGLADGVTYAGLIQTAFQPAYWSAPVDANAEFTQMEANFALFWGLALQAYQATLVSDDSRFDRFQDGDASALTALEQQGLRTFQGGASQCTRCHVGPEFTAAAYSTVLRAGPNPNNPNAIGFFRIGSSPIDEDAGLGGTDGFGAALFNAARAGAANGTFKAPSLRNVELTGPYFHNGSQATLEQVLDFYGRNGDFPAGGNLGPGIGAIRLSPQDRTAIVAFLKSLTDDRVRYQQAPFDHPSLCVPHGHPESAPGVLQVNDAEPGRVAADQWALVKETGAGGLSVPLQTFDEMLRGVGLDGSRGNSLGQGCTP